MAASTVTPLYDVCDTVRYRDHHKRLQTGIVNRIEAHWSRCSQNQPLIIYAVHHPTYRNKRMYVGVDDILGLATPGSADR
jgi:hypothetical protein